MIKRPMTIDNFLVIMDANRGIWPEYDALEDKYKRYIANLNICTGTAHSYFDMNGHLLGVGGIRYIGIGEAWFITLPDCRKPSLLKTVSEEFKLIRDEKNLWEIFAESRVSQNFLTHLNFEKKDGMFLWMRR